METIRTDQLVAEQLNVDTATAAAGIHDLYFESAAMILTLITVGKMLEARSKGKTTDALKSLMKLAPKTATVIRKGEEVSVKRPDGSPKTGNQWPVTPEVLRWGPRFLYER